MQPANAAFPLKYIVSGILLCFTPAVTATPNLSEAAVYSAQWLPVHPQVSVNGSVSDGLYEFISHNEKLLVQNQTLIQLGIRVPADVLHQAQTAAAPQQENAAPAPQASETPDTAVSDAAAPEAAAAAEPASETPPAQGAWYVLGSIPGLEAQYRAAEQVLTLTAPLDWLNLPTTRIGPQQEQAYEAAQPGFAAVLNYDYNVTHNHNGDTGHGLLAEARLATPAGYLSHNHLWNRHKQNTAALSSNVRLDTYWRTVWADKGLVLTAGDVLTGRLGGQGGTRLGGIKLEHTYSVQPWRNTTPLLSYLGESTLPGTVDLYLNGVKQYGRDIAAGKYEITLPPAISGSGMAQVVATDVLGRTVTIDMPLYGGSGLLAKGLSEWSVEAGYLRRNYGTESDSYGRPAAAGTWRYGITNALTAQLHAEGARGYRQFGAASSMVLGTLGQLNLSHARSSLNARSGSRSSAFFNTDKGRWSFGAGWSRTDGGFAHLGEAQDAQPLAETRAARTASASLGWNGEALGSLSLSYLYAKQGQEKPDKIATFNWNRNIGRRTGVFFSASHHFGNSGLRSIQGGISVSLDKGYSGSFSGHNDSGGSGYRLSLGKSSQGLGSPSWNIGWHRQKEEHGSRGRLNGQINYDTQYGDARAGVYHTRSGADWNAGWRGGLVWMGGGLFAARPVNNSFAVVSTDGVADVPVSLFNSKAGRTNRKGLLLVPNLSAYQQNAIDIDITDLPQNIYAERARIQAVPSERSGVSVRFKLNRMQGVSFTLKEHGGAFVAGGSTIFRSDGTPVAVVGFDGQTFIEHLETGSNRFTAELPEGGGRCRFSADYRETGDGSLPDLGEIVCIKE